MRDGLTEEEVSEYLEILRERCADVSDDVLAIIAHTYTYPDLTCVDLAEVLSCLSFPGDKLVVVASASGPNRALTALMNALAETEARGANPAFAASALAIIKGNWSFNLQRDFYPVMEILQESMHPDALVVADAPWDYDGEELNLTLIFSGIQL